MTKVTCALACDVYDVCPKRTRLNPGQIGVYFDFGNITADCSDFVPSLVYEEMSDQLVYLTSDCDDDREGSDDV